MKISIFMINFYYRLKMSFTNRLELSVGNEVLRPNDDRRLVSAVPLRDRMVCSTKGFTTNSMWLSSFAFYY